MDVEFACLSLPELLDIRDGVADDEASEHLATCPRCRALLSTIPNDFVTVASGDVMPTIPVEVVTRNAPVDGSSRAGALWRALAEPSADFSWVVAVIAAAPDAADRLLVAPVFGAPAVPTEHDLLLGADALGYEAFVDVANTGAILTTQLSEPLGQLPAATTELLQMLYRAVLSDGAAPPPETVGTPVTGSQDPRLLDADERRDALRRLWRAADSLVDSEEEAVVSHAAFEDLQEAPVALPALFASYLDWPATEWDRSSLLERSGADGAMFDRFCKNVLDLTDQSDVADLAKVIHVLEIPWERAEPAVLNTLWASPGGTRRASQSTELPLAARGASGASDKDISDALNLRHSQVDQSDAAREQQVASYLAELRKALDDLE